MHSCLPASTLLAALDDSSNGLRSEASRGRPTKVDMDALVTEWARHALFRRSETELAAAIPHNLSRRRHWPRNIAGKQLARFEFGMN